MILEQFYSKRKRVKQDVSKIVMKEKNPTITIISRMIWCEIFDFQKVYQGLYVYILLF